MNLQKKRLIIIVPIILIGVAVSGFFLVNYALQKRLPHLLGNRVKASGFNYDLGTRSIWFDQPSFQMKGTKEVSDFEIFAVADSILITGYSIWGLLFNQKLGVDQLVIDGLSVEIALPQLYTTDTEKEEINLFIKEIFTEIRVDHFQLNRGNFLVRKRDSTTSFLEIDNLNISAKEVLADTGTIKHVFPLTFSESKIEIETFKVRLGEDYWLTGEQLLVADTSFVIQNLDLSPIHSRDDFAERHSNEKPQFRVKVKELSSRKFLWNITPDNFVSVAAEKTVFERPQIEVYKQKKSESELLDIKPLLGSMIKTLPFSVSFDTVTFRNGLISYEQKPVRRSKSGKVFFSSFYMSAYYLVNDSVILSKQTAETVIDIKCKLMGTGNLDTQIHLDLSSEDDAFTVSGSLSSMALDEVNEVLKPLAGIDATGDLQQLDFEISGNNYASEGTVLIDYESLSITVFDREQDKKWLVSEIGNLMLRNNNQSSNSSGFKKGDIYFIRYQNKGFFNYLWNSVQVGMMDVINPFYKNPDLSPLTRSQEIKFKK